jgi:hypothetical protein
MENFTPWGETKGWIQVLKGAKISISIDMNRNNKFIPDFMLSKLDNLGYQLKQMYNIAVTFIKIISKGWLKLKKNRYSLQSVGYLLPLVESYNYWAVLPS